MSQPNRSTKSVRSLSLIAALGGLASGAFGNILTNAGFEDDTAWAYIFTLGDDTGYSTQAAHTGQRSFKFSTAADVINLSQAVAFVPGQQYELSFWVLNYGVGNDLLAGYMHTSDPVPTDVAFFDGPVGTGLESWEQVSFNFVVPAGDYWRLVFHGYDNNAAFYVDDFSLTVVPGPGVGVLASLAGFVGVRRRR